MVFLRKNRKRLTAIAVLFFAAVLIALGSIGLLKRYQATHNPNPAIPVQTITYSTASPDETPPGNACDTYKVAANEPRMIDLPSIGASGCIQKVGLDQHNAIAAPTNIHVAGWYTSSMLPGQKGVSVIDGHLSGRYGPAIFANLEKLKPEDKIRVQFGDESWKEFVVISLHSYPVDTVMTKLFEPSKNNKNQLNLITCDGAYDAGTKTFDRRVVVQTALL